MGNIRENFIVNDVVSLGFFSQEATMIIKKLISKTSNITNV